MDKRIKELWTADLRANGDKQGKNCLRDKEDKYCCLGRLVELAIAEGVPVTWDANKSAKIFYLRGDNGLIWGGVLPPSVQDWAGLSQINPAIGETNCIDANDNKSKTFDEIADLIDEHISGEPEGQDG